MRPGTTLLAISCAIALAACGGDDDRSAGAAGNATDNPVNAAPANSGAMDEAMAPSPETGTADPVQAAAVDQAPPIDPMLDGPGGDVTADAAMSTDPASGEADASSGSCEVTIEGNDRMQFNVDSIKVPASCSQFTINLAHVGQLPVAAMGHNVVVVETADFAGVAADGLTAGAEADYVPANDGRVIAHTEMIGGGERTSVTLSTSGLEEGGDYTFFCSFPGHSALMRGSLDFGG